MRRISTTNILKLKVGGIAVFCLLCKKDILCNRIKTVPYLGKQHMCSNTWHLRIWGCCWWTKLKINPFEAHDTCIRQMIKYPFMQLKSFWILKKDNWLIKKQNELWNINYIMSVCIGKKFDKIFQNIKLANQFQRKHRGNLSIFSQVSYERFSENKKIMKQ